MQVSLEAKRNGVAFRRPTFQNPLVKIARAFLRFFESVSYARAAAELARQGLHKEAKALMLYKAEFDRKES